MENAIVATNGTNMMTIESKGFYSSLKAETTEEKVMLYNAQNNPDFRLKESINMEIGIVNIIAEIVTLDKKNEKGQAVVNDDGEIITNDAPRIVLIDSNGKSHQCVSVGIYNAVKKIIALFGEPSTWEKPLVVRVKNVAKGERAMLSLEVVGFQKEAKK